MKYIKTYETIEFKRYIVYDIKPEYVILRVIKNRPKSFISKIILSINNEGQIKKSNDKKNFEICYNREWLKYIVYQTDNLEDAIEKAKLMKATNKYNL